jgi:hypothetical protein
MEYCNELSGDSWGICRPGNAYVFYREDGNRIQFDVSGLTEDSAPAIALNVKTGEFLELGVFSKTMTSWTAPEKSSWALAIGRFPGKGDADMVGR